MFNPVNSKVDFPKVEEKVLAFWREKKVFERSVEARKGGPRFTLYEGPPTANGNPGIHHVLARVFKDVIPRYKVMKGFYAPRIAGWDTHGLPVELEVEKKLGISSKPQIEEYGIAKFNAKCKDSVSGYLKNWDAMTERIGFWVDLQHPYVTMNNEYMETCWWIIKQLWDRGLVYQGYKVTPHCPRCGTSLSSHEVALGYQEDTEDPSVYVKFRIVPSTAPAKLVPFSGKPLYFLVWTTTPWTLPGNTAVALAAEADYAVIETDGEYLIMADALRARVGLGDFKVAAEMKGSELAGTHYEPLYNPHDFNVERKKPVSLPSPDGKVMRKEFRVQKPEALTYHAIATDFVSMEDGTGIVHIAPAFGEVDFEAGLENGLDFVQQVDLQGKLIGTYPFSGKFVKDADKDILADLQNRGLLFRSEKIKHTYPFCWRCDTPLLYYAKQSWYIMTTAVKDAMIANNNKLNWYPEHIRYGRFGDWLENNVDWAFSRERYWGTPLPVWRCESCGKCDCIGSIEELVQKSGISREAIKAAPLGLHRPFVDELSLACTCGGRMKRVPEVIDCWFDSGAMPLAQCHYPFDPESKNIFKDGRFPADYICEAVDQTRGWFYSLHAISTLLFNQPSFKNVICLGHVLDVKGEKMSKSRGNVVLPEKIISKYGADALRWYCLTAGPPGNVRRFSEDMVAEITRRFQLILWNVYSFFVTYANIDNFKPETQLAKPGDVELDRWITSELNQLIADVDKALNSYDPTEAGRRIEDFTGYLSNWYVRRSRRRFWKSENDTDKLSAYNTLYGCLATLSKLLAPLAPFMAEELYQNLVCPHFSSAPDSVHLADFPVADTALIDKELSADIRLAMRVSSLGRAARSQAAIKVRQPIAKALVYVKSGRDREGLARVTQQVLDELNVKSLELVESASGLEKPEYSTTTEGDCTVAVPKELSPELLAEGMAREIVHRLQTQRRSAGFDIADHIMTYYLGDEYIAQVMKDFADYVKQETLSRELVSGTPAEGAYTESFKLSGHEITIGVKREGS